MEEVGWTVKECAGRLGITPNNLSRLLNGRIGISPRVALRLEAVGWSNAEFWMRLQAHYDLAQARRRNQVSKTSKSSTAESVASVEVA